MSRKFFIIVYAAVGILALLIVGSGIAYKRSLTPHFRDVPAAKIENETISYPGKHVVIFLDDMRLELRNGTSTIGSFGLVTKGKPGSYYETIGGIYESDYKEKSHFSTIGHVYLPWSVHIFGNYFIHGIPSYPDGRKVSSEYSGGCIRLEDADAERVYDFISRGMPIIIVGNDVAEFTPTATSTEIIHSMLMTRYMVATISLEVLSQDNMILDADGATTTRRKMLSKLLLSADDSVSHIFGKDLGEAVFVEYMNKKARAIGLTNTLFSSLDSPSVTTKEDESRFIRYLQNYKSYLLTISSSTQPELSQ